MKAVYAVVFNLSEQTTVEIGALGEIDFRPGMYVYVGSAMNNVEKRIGRHFSFEKKEHWHIDYFSKAAEPIDYFILPEVSEYECVLADIVSGFAEPVEDFGSSDCRCDAHMFYIYNSE